MSTQTDFTGETPTEISFHFFCVCEDCGAEGDLTLDKADGYKPFNCPEGCGCVYVPWQNADKWELTCVVEKYVIFLSRTARTNCAN